MNNRRRILVAFGASALTAPLGAFAQQPAKVYRIGFLTTRRRPDSLDSDIIGALLQGMRDLGYVEGKNLMIEWRFADGRTERLAGLAAELVQQKVDLIVAIGTVAASAAQKATTAIPIVMGNVGDPVGSGLIKSLARPGGNITGLSNILGDISPKHVEMLRGMAPKLSRVAVLVNSANSAHATILKNVQAAVQGAGVKIVPVEVKSSQEIENAFALMIRENAGAVIVVSDAIFNQHLRRIADLATKNRLPSVHLFRDYAEAGGLMSYGPSHADIYRRTATYVDKILKGAKPGELPVEQPTRFELIINGKTAKALGLKIPQSLLISADKVIE